MSQEQSEAYDVPGTDGGPGGLWDDVYDCTPEILRAAKFAASSYKSFFENNLSMIMVSFPTIATRLI